MLFLLFVPTPGPAQWRPWPGAGFGESQHRLLSSEETAGPKEQATDLALDLTLVQLRGTPWTEKRILSHVRRTAAIYERCGIALGEVVLARVRTPRHDLDLAAKVPGSQLPQTVVDLSAQIPPSSPWPVVFFIGKLDGGAGPARAFRRGEVDPGQLSRYPYMNTAWLSFRAHWVERASPGYSTLAHEVGHLLCECGHADVRERHLMNGFRNFLGESIRPADCKRFRESSLLRRE